MVRSAVALSMVTEVPVRIENIRARRKKPGLRPQHMTAIAAAREVCQAQVTGASEGSRRLVFEPGDVRPGSYTFDIGTAGSTTLVAQTVLPALYMASGPAQLVIRGGTHNPLAPPFDFFARTYNPCLRQMGICVEARLLRRGFYPAGGGEIQLDIVPSTASAPLELVDRGERLDYSAVAIVANLPEHIAQRELTQLASRGGWSQQQLKAEIDNEARGPGNVVLVFIESDSVCETFAAFGRRGVPAERVADEVFREAKEYVRSKAAVGQYLADQLLLPMALCGGGKFTTVPVSSHTTTHIGLIKQFLSVEIEIEQTSRRSRLVSVGRCEG